MDYVPSTNAVAAAAQKSPPIDATARAASKSAAPTEPIALDPRSAYVLAPGTADAVLSLANVKAQAVSAADFETRYVHATHITETVTAVATAPVVAPEPVKATSAANRNWSEDVRLDHSPTRKVGADTVVQYDTPRIVAAWAAAFPDIPNRKYRGLTPADTNVKPEVKMALMTPVAALVPKDIHLLCNTDNYKTFSEAHPHTNINWIPVDNEEVLLFWPSQIERTEGDDHSAHRRDPEDDPET
ncbi:hypothetical protein [Methylobacterium sp. SI9]|uniref:hypothetical protein n=1 Tax=Methylobacterium guangdongense TaxID=3138811 RepID=UPI00313D3FC8